MTTIFGDIDPSGADAYSEGAAADPFAVAYRLHELATWRAEEPSPEEFNLAAVIVMWLRQHGGHGAIELAMHIHDVRRSRHPTLPSWDDLTDDDFAALAAASFRALDEEEDARRA